MILALGGTALLIELSGQMIARAQSEVVKQIDAWGTTLERARARLLGRPESEP
jgi:hypothetical protein